MTDERNDDRQEGPLRRRFTVPTVLGLWGDHGGEVEADGEEAAAMWDERRWRRDP